LLSFDDFRIQEKCFKKMVEPEGVEQMVVDRALGEVELDVGNLPEHYRVKVRTIPRTMIIVKAMSSHSQTLPGRVLKLEP
jgi:hypothetical protein